MSIVLDGSSLKLSDFIDVTRGGAKVVISREALARVAESRKIVDALVAEGRPMYGINTGFGKFSDVAIPEDELNLLQINLIRADAVGVGVSLSIEVSRGMMLLRLNSLLKGYSGVRPIIVETLAAMLNNLIHPVIPEKGSVGSSGDLCPLAHMTMPMIGEGEAELNGKILPGAEAMKRAGIPLVELRAKEGLSLINGTQCMTSVGAHALWDAINLCKAADIIGALTAESLCGIKDAYDHRLHDIRAHFGQTDVAENMRKLTEGSEYMTRQGEVRMQDSYSLRCIPQIHGASRLAIDYVARTIETELNSVTDNPIVLSSDEVYSGGNFHGQPIAIAMDTLGIAVSELANISERRIAKLIDPALNHGLPAFLVKNGGINCGFMVPQYAAAALVSENKVLAHPSSVDSIPTSAGQEDHVSMGTIGARKAATIVSHVEAVLGIEWMSAAQAIDLQERRKLGRGTEVAYAELRKCISYMKDDRIFYKDQATAADKIHAGKLVHSVEQQIGKIK